MRMEVESSPNPQFFEACIERWILGALHDGCANFAQLIRMLPGVYPTWVIAALRRMTQEERLIPSWIYESAIQEVTRPVSSHPEVQHTILLPRPHPLDYEWRFTDDTTLHLAKRVEAMTNQQE